MAAKPKSKIAAGLCAALWLLALAALLVSGMAGSYAYIERSGYTYYAYPSFIDQLRLCSMVRYWQARCAWDNVEYAPSAVLLSDENSLFHAMARATGEDPFTVDFGAEDRTASAEQPEQHGGLDVYSERAAALIDDFNQMIFDFARSFDSGWGSLQYTVVDPESGAIYAPKTDLSGFLQRDSFALDAWDYVIAVNYNKSGETAIVRDWMLSSPNGATIEYWEHYGSSWDTLALSYFEMADELFQYYDLAPPRGVALIFAVPKDLPAYDELTGYGTSNQIHRLYSAFNLLFWPVIGVCALLALWFGRRRGSGLGGKRLAALPLEAGIALLFGAGTLGGALLSQCLVSLCDGSISQNLADNFSIDLPAAADTFAFFMAMLVALPVLAAVFLPVLAVRQGVARHGWRRYLFRYTLAGQALRLTRLLWRAVGRQIMRMWSALTRVDLRDSADRTLLRLLAINFVIVTFICCFWVFGILGTLLYTILLFFLLRGRMVREQQHYAALLDAARRMAAGDLTAPIAGELGMFDALRDELNQVRDGFEKAVAAEVRSQNMKTELISNVSHDLKTPLTAIITYVDLLKDPGLSEADRARYIDTLDRKSQRLKRLIEDLFEVSKAATGNVTVHYAETDLAALLKQMQYELADSLQSCGVDFRWQLPEGRVPLVLDGQKTCRIFENLLVNITKYGMPGTRAYITLTPLADGAQIVFKNISATELDFDAQHITERFVRGDRSRNTEGSGLGLAIVKSFAELQGGSFEVAVDGDLFKAIVTLKSGNLPEASAMPEPPKPSGASAMPEPPKPSGASAMPELPKPSEASAMPEPPKPSGAGMQPELFAAGEPPAASGPEPARPKQERPKPTSTPELPVANEEL